MSRSPRAGTAGKPVTFRATEPELATWGRASASEGCNSLSAWIVKTLNRRAAAAAQTAGAGNSRETARAVRRNPRRS